MTTGDPFLDFALGLRSSGLTPLMKLVSEANAEAAYMVLVPVIYWVLSRRIGYLLLLVDAVGTATAVVLKDALAMPRPPDAGETAWLARADGFGFPSGHTTAAATTWAALAALTRSPRLAAFGALVTFGVAFSRLYLGVHYTRDVAGGAAIGLALGLVLLLGLHRLEAGFRRLPRGLRYAAVLAFPALLAVNASPDAIMILCATAGAAAGQLASTERGWVLATGDPRRLPLYGGLRLILGLPVLAALALALGDPDTAAPLVLAARFAALGLFVTLIGPRIFLAVEARLAPATSAPAAST